MEVKEEPVYDEMVISEGSCHICGRMIGTHKRNLNKHDKVSAESFSGLFSCLFGIQAKYGPQNLCISCSRELETAFRLRTKIESNEKILNSTKTFINVQENVDHQQPNPEIKAEQKSDLSESSSDDTSEEENRKKNRKKFSFRAKKIEEEEIKCPLCDYRSNVKDNYQKHVLRRHNRQELKCDGCDEKYHLIYMLESHRKYDHDFTHEYVVDERLKLSNDQINGNKLKITKAVSENNDDSENSSSDEENEEQKKKKGSKKRKYVKQEENEEIKCPLCDYKSNVKDNYQKHVLRIHKRQEMKCDGCEEKYHLIYLLESHRRDVHGFTHEYVVDESLKLTKPKINDFKFRTIKQVSSNDNEDNGDSIRCPLCPYVSQKTSCFVTHFKRAHHNIKFQCDGCSAKDDHFYRLLRHRKNEHGFDHEYVVDEKLIEEDKRQKEKRRIEKGQQSKCPHCDQWFKKERHISKHLRVVHKMQIRPKGRPSGESSNYNKSTDNKSSDTKPNVNKTVKKLICMYCGKSLSNSSYDYHIRNMHPEYCDPFICHYCDAKLKTKAALLFHMQKIHGYPVRTTRGSEAVFNCKYCDKTFRFKNSRKAHEIRYHTLDFAFTCNICEKKFVERFKFNEHLKRHQEGKRLSLKCDICEEHFPKRALLTEHISTHFNTNDELSQYSDVPQFVLQRGYFK